MTLGQIQAALKRGGRQRNIERRAKEIQTALRTAQLAAPAAVAEAFATTTRAAVGIIAEMNRQIAGDTAEAEAIRIMARGHQNLIWSRSRQTNALRSALREYYPAALETFDDFADRDTLAVLARHRHQRRVPR